MGGLGAGSDEALLWERLFVKRVGHRNQVLGQRNGSGMSIESSMPEPMGWDCQAGWCSPDVSGGNPELLR